MKRSRDAGGRLDGKKAVITGGGTGIGRGIALAYVEEGCDVVICGRRGDVLAETCTAAASLGGGTMTSLLCDQTDEAAVVSTVKAAAGMLDGRIDILVLNAGSNITNRSLDKVDAASWRTLIDINLNGPFYFVNAVLPLMREGGGGTVINISSIAGLRALELSGAAYSASKAGLNMIGAQINLEEGKHGIRCTNICPGEVDTPILDKRAKPPPAEARAQMAQPSDLGEVAVMVASMPPRVFIPTITVTGITTLALSV